MSREEQKRIKDLATNTLKQNRSKEEILKTLHDAGIIDSDGDVRSPYNKVFVKR